MCCVPCGILLHPSNGCKLHLHLCVTERKVTETAFLELKAQKKPDSFPSWKGWDTGHVANIAWTDVVCLASRIIAQPLVEASSTEPRVHAAKVPCPCWLRGGVTQGGTACSIVESVSHLRTPLFVLPSFTGDKFLITKLLDISNPSCLFMVFCRSCVKAEQHFHLLPQTSPRRSMAPGSIFFFSLQIKLAPA